MDSRKVSEVPTAKGGTTQPSYRPIYKVVSLTPSFVTGRLTLQVFPAYSVFIINANYLDKTAQRKPSIASGNQVCKPNCADLPTAPINKNRHIKVILSEGESPTILNKETKSKHPN